MLAEVPTASALTAGHPGGEARRISAGQRDGKLEGRAGEGSYSKDKTSPTGVALGGRIVDQKPTAIEEGYSRRLGRKKFFNRR